MKKNDYSRTTDLLALLVFGIFALCVAAVLLTGARVYKNLTLRGQTAHEHRVAARYVTTRFRQAPEVQVEDFCGLQVMTAREEIGGKIYITRIYCYEGYIRELFAAESASLSPSDGEKILPAEDLTFSVASGILSVVITHADGVTQQVLLALPLWKEAAS